MATALWITELENGSEIYMDFLSFLSENGPGIPNYEFIEWDVRSINTDWQRKFLDTDLESIKQKSTTDTFMDRGVLCYNRDDWRESMEYFNQALCFAKIGSIDSSALFAYRAFCFAKMEMYEKAIKDADIALTPKLPAKLRQKLQRRRAAWEEKVSVSTKEGHRQTANAPELSFDADKECPCMANVLEIKETDDFRSYIVARADIDVGQVVLVETGFVSIANGYDRASCLTCMNTLTNLIPCTQCTDAMFCNIDCMTANKVHKIWCDEPYNRMPIDIRFVVQSILQAIILFPTVDLLMEFVTAIQHKNAIDFQAEPQLFDYGLFLCLLSDEVATDLPLVLIYKAYKTLMSMSSIQLKFDTEIKRRFLMNLVGHHAHVLKNNAFGDVFNDKIDDREQFVTGTISTIAALFEHSCAPNLMHFPIGNREIFVTLRPIKAGEHLNFDYWLEWADKIKSDDVNRSSLLKSKEIQCECGKCECHTISNETMSADQSFHVILNFKRRFGNHVAPILKQNCVNFLRKFHTEPWTKEMEIVTKTLAHCFLSEFNVER